MPKAFLFNGIITLQKLFGGYMKNVLVVIDMQNDFCSPKGKFAQAGRAADSIIEIVPACRKLLEAARQANVFVVHIQQSTLPGEQSDNGGWIAFKTRDGKAPTYATVNTWGWQHIEELAPYCDGENGSCLSQNIGQMHF